MTLQSASQNSASLLHRALHANAIFSSISGLAFIIASKPIALFLGLAAPFVLIVIGVGLLTLLVAKRDISYPLRSPHSVE